MQPRQAGSRPSSPRPSTVRRPRTKRRGPRLSSGRGQSHPHALTGERRSTSPDGRATLDETVALPMEGGVSCPAADTIAADDEQERRSRLVLLHAGSILVPPSLAAPLATLNEAFWRSRPAVGEEPAPGRRPGDILGGHKCQRGPTAPRSTARVRNQERGTRGMYSACPSCAESTDLQAASRCRRRDSNPRHADYDSVAPWLYSAVCGGWGTQKGTQPAPRYALHSVPSASLR